MVVVVVVVVMMIINSVFHRMLATVTNDINSDTNVIESRRHCYTPSVDVAILTLVLENWQDTYLFVFFYFIIFSKVQQYDVQV